MQFDGNELEKDENNTSVNGDNNAISWEDLLNTDDDSDLSKLIIGSDDTEEDAVKEKSDAQAADNQSTVQSVSSQENKTEFDINEAANNYVNSLDKDDAVIDDEFFGVEENKDKKDLSDVVDDELLSLLDVKNDTPSSYTESNLDDILEFDKNGDIKNANEVNQPKTNANEAYMNSKEEIEEVDSQDEQYENNTESIAQYDEISEAQPVYEKKQNKNRALAVVLGLVGLFAVIVVALYFLFPNMAGNIGSEELVSSENSNYTLPDETQNEANAMQKQTEELINKLENKAEDNSKQNTAKKKVVVSIQSTGRANPFMPSTLFNEDGSLAMGADLSIPPDVDVNSPEAVAARKLMSIGVSGIMYDENAPSAILKFDNNDYFVQKGDRIDTYIVSRITKDYVQITNGANTYKAYVGEAFNIGEIPQSRQMKYTGGTRQYVSADDIEISTK